MLFHGVVVQKPPWPADIVPREASLPLHLESDDPSLAVENEVYLHPARRSPVVQVIPQAQVLHPRLQPLKDQRLQGGPVDLLGGTQRAAGTNRLISARIEEVELRVHHQASTRPLSKHGHPDSDEEVFQNLEGALGNLPMDS